MSLIFQNRQLSKNLQKFYSGKRSPGFSLVELMVVIAIIAIVAGIAIPTYLRWLPNYRLKAATQDMYSNFQRAKLTAVQRNLNCAVSFGETVGGTAFDYAIYVDADGNCEYDAGEDVIVTQNLAQYYNVRFDPTTIPGGADGLSFVDNDNGNPTISFRPNGIPTGNGGGFATGTVFFDNSVNNTNVRRTNIVVNVAGSVSVN